MLWSWTPNRQFKIPAYVSVWQFLRTPSVLMKLVSYQQVQKTVCLFSYLRGSSWVLKFACAWFSSANTKDLLLLLTHFIFNMWLFLVQEPQLLFMMPIKNNNVLHYEYVSVRKGGANNFARLSEEPNNCSHFTAHWFFRSARKSWK